MRDDGKLHPARVAVALGAAALLAVVIGWAAGPPATAARELGTADFATALSAAAALGAWLVVAWLALTALATVFAVAAHAPGAAGRFAAGAYRRLSPLIWRRAVECTVGFALAGSALAGPALSASAAPAAAAPAAPAPVAVAHIDLDRPVAPAVPAAATTAPMVGVDLDRPGEAASDGFTPSAPPSPPRTLPPAAADAVRLVTSGDHQHAEPDDGYVVRRGDTLWDIAARHLGPGASAAQIARAWPHWYAANRDLIGADPAHILPGQHLRTPAP